jgi:hypothetical protein
MSSVTDLYSSLQGWRVRENERVRERERDKTSKTRGYYATRIRERRYVSEPIETKYRIFRYITRT